MADVIQLFARKNADIVPVGCDPRAVIATNSILSSTIKLKEQTKELSEQFDAIENAIGSIGDTETGTRLRESMKRSREMLLKAMLELTQQIGKVVGALH